MSYLLEREAQRLAEALRAYARDARALLADDACVMTAEELLDRLAAKLDAGASGLEHELAALHQARERDAARQRATEPSARQFGRRS